REREIYITILIWALETKVAVTWLNKRQSVNAIDLGDAKTKFITMTHEDSRPLWQKKQNEKPGFSKGRRVFEYVRARPSGSRGAWYMITASASQPCSDQAHVRSLAKKFWEITSIIIYEEKRSNIYFLKTEIFPRFLQIYSQNKVRNFRGQTLECDFLQSIRFFSFQMSHWLEFFTEESEGPGKPDSTVYNRTEGRKWYDMTKGQHVWKSIHDKGWPAIKRNTLQINDQNLLLNIVRPSTMSAVLHYPRGITIKGTPGKESVHEKFETSWANSIVTSHGMFLMRCISKGSGFQLSKIMHRSRKRKGRREESDQMESLLTLLKENYFLKLKLSLYSKLYLVYLTTYLGPALGEKKSQIIFLCGCLTIPIYKLRMYSIFLSNRYLGMKGLDQKWSEMTSVALRVSALKEKDLLIVHQRTVDDKYHLQHKAEVPTHLIRGQVNYILQVYPSAGHSFTSVSLKQHLPRKMVNIFVNCFRRSDQLPAATRREDSNEN
uniref:A-type potassium channel modulatory protein DPP6 n=1 Tax=Callithrix jacchus TaxID=9483 RepID=A0A8I3XF53_CALJA